MRRLEWMAVGWGGLIAAIGLLIGAESGSGWRTGAVVASFVLGGFLAGVRAEDLRLVHAAVAAVAAYAFHALFVVLANVADVVGGPAPPSFMPGNDADWGITAGVALAASLVGGFVASVRLRPSRRDAHRRRAA